MTRQDALFIEALRMHARIGVYPREKKRSQLIEISLRMGLPRPLSAIAELEHTVDYAQLCGRLQREVQSRHFALLEHLAQHLMAVISQDFHAPWVEIKISKMGVLAATERVGIQVYGTAEDYAK